MSQYLCIGHDVNGGYDCVLTSMNGARETMRSKWLCCKDKIYLRPFKITIVDPDLFRRIESVIAEVLQSVGEQYPDDVRSFYYQGRTIEHPTQQDLSRWLEDGMEINELRWRGVALHVDGSRIRWSGDPGDYMEFPAPVTSLTKHPRKDDVVVTLANGRSYCLAGTNDPMCPFRAEEMPKDA